MDRKESKLTKAEKRAAKKSYEDEKRASVPYSRPSYAPYYPTSDQALANIPAFNQRGWWVVRLHVLTCKAPVIVCLMVKKMLIVLVTRISLARHLQSHAN